MPATPLLVISPGPRQGRRARLAAAVVALALALALVLALPASAWASGGSVAASRSGYTTATQSSADGLNSIKVSATFTGVIEGNGLRLLLECDAQAAGFPAATSVSDCSALVAGVRYETEGLSLPGAAAAVADTHRTALSAITVCVTGRVVPVFGDDVSATKCVTEGLGIDLDPTLPQLGTLVGFGYTPGGNLLAPVVCGAVAPGAVATSVLECTVAGRWSGPPVSTAGPVAATSFLVGPAGEDVHPVCWRVRALFADGSTQERSGCGIGVSAPDLKPWRP